MKNSTSQHHGKKFSGLKTSYQISKYFREKQCPICNGVHSSCRETTEGWVICRSGYEVPGYQLIRTNASSFSEYILQEEADSYSEEKIRQAKERWEKENKERIAGYKKSLSNADRHGEIQKLISQLRLSEKHRKILLARGFKGFEIELLGFRTIEKFQKLSIRINPNLAGINYIGKGLTYAGEEGILCPIPDPNGQWIGFKINDPNANKEEGQAKYPWPVSKANKNRPKKVSAHLQNGEMPIAYRVPVLSDSEVPKGIGFSEGPEYKSTLISLRRKEVVLGISGGMSGVKQIKEYLSEWKGDKNFTIWADAGSGINKNVLSQYRRIAGAVKSQGFEVKVAWYGQNSKQNADPDEYFGTYFQIPFKTWLDRFTILAKKKKKELVSNVWSQPENSKQVSSKSIQDKKPLTRREEYLQSLKFDKTSIIKGKYVDFKVLFKAPNVAVRSPMGSGKTEALVKYVDDRRKKGQSVLLLGSRNSTLIQICRRLNIEHLLLDGDAGTLKNWGSSEAVAHCVDSLFRWVDANGTPDIVIIDEVSSVIPHLLIGGTCRKLRKTLLGQFEKVLSGAKRIILMDALLKDWEVNYIEKIINKSFLKLYKQTRETPLRIRNYLGTTKDVLDKPLVGKHGHLNTELLNSFDPNNTDSFQETFLNASEKGNYAFFSDSRRKNETLIALKYGKKYLDFYEALSIGILRVDSETSNYPEVLEFLKNPDKFIAEKKIKGLFCSPAVESGLSVNKKGYFKNLFFYNSHLPNEPIMQMLLRVRDRKCLRHIFCKKSAPVSARQQAIEEDSKNGFVNYVSEIFTAYGRNYQDSSLESLQESKDKTKKDILDELSKTIDSKFNDVNHLAAIGRIESQQGYEKSRLRETLMRRLVEEGNYVEDVVTGGKNNNLKIKEINSANAIRKGTNLFSAPDEITRNGRVIKMDIETAEAISMEYCASPEEKLSASKYLFKEKTLPGIENTPYWTPEFIARYRFLDEGLSNQFFMRCAINNIEYFKKINFIKLDRQIADDAISLPTDINTSFLKTVSAEKTGLLKLMQTCKNGEEYVSDDKRLQKLADKLSSRRNSVYFGTQGGVRLVTFINRALKCFGYKLKGTTRKKDGKSIRYYHVVDILATNEFADTIHQILSNKYQKIAQENQEQHNELIRIKKEANSISKNLKKVEVASA